MTASREDLAGLPGWPLWLAREQAAAYVGASPGHFDSEVRAGRWPRGADRSIGKTGKCIRWWRPALDEASKQLAEGARAAHLPGTTMAEASEKSREAYKAIETVQRVIKAKNRRYFWRAEEAVQDLGFAASIPLGSNPVEAIDKAYRLNARVDEAMKQRQERKSD